MQRLLVLAFALSTSACLFQPVAEVDAAHEHDAPSVSDAGPDDAAYPTWDANVTHDATRPDAHTEDVWTADATTEPDTGPPPLDGVVRTTAGLVSHYIFAESLDDRVRPDASIVLPQDDDGRAYGHTQLPGGTYNDVLATENFSFEANVFLQGEGVLLQCGDVVKLDATPVGSVAVDEHAALTVAFGSQEFVVPEAMVRLGTTHVAWVRENTIARLYIRGALVAAIEVNSNVGVHGCSLGTSGNTSRNIAYESIALYDRALSPGEVAMHALAGSRVVPTVDRELTDLAVRVHARTGVSSSAASARSITIVGDSIEQLAHGQFAFGSKILMKLGPFNGVRGVPGQVVSSRLHLLGPLQTSGAALKVYPMLRGWDDHATWFGPTEDALWEEPGAIGSFDRGPHVAEALVTEHTVLAVDLDVTSLVAEWVADEHNNDGVQIECNTCNGMVFPESQTSAGRPTFITIFEAPRPMPPEPPNVTVDGRLEWQDYGNTVEMEVYLDERLVARVPGTSWPLEGLRETKLTFIAVDAWGQRSVRTTVTTSGFMP